MRFNKYKLKPSTSPLLFTILFFSSSMTWANYACLYPFAKLKKDESLIQSSEWSPQKVTDKLQQVILATHVLNHKPVIIGDENALDLLRFVQRNPYRAETGSILQALTHFSAKRTSSVRIFTAQMVRSNKEKGKNPDNNLELMRPLIFLNKSRVSVFSFEAEVATAYFNYIKTSQDLSILKPIQSSDSFYTTLFALLTWKPSIPLPKAFGSKYKSLEETLQLDKQLSESEKKDLSNQLYKAIEALNVALEHILTSGIKEGEEFPQLKFALALKELYEEITFLYDIQGTQITTLHPVAKRTVRRLQEVMALKHFSSPLLIGVISSVYQLQNHPLASMDTELQSFYKGAISTLKVLYKERRFNGDEIEVIRDLISQDLLPDIFDRPLQ